MTFEEAITRCPPGLYVKAIRGGWTERHIQYGVSEQGIIFWTAGHTTGGPLEGAKRRKLGTQSTDFAIYRWGANLPIDPVNLPVIRN